MNLRHAAAVVLAVTLISGCQNGGPHGGVHYSNTHDNTSVGNQASSIFGSAKATVYTIACAGRIALSQGAATVKDSCFTGDTDVVSCTDMTAPMPVMCTPANGSLTIRGTGSDRVSYARLR
jgi:hypothetical protein